MWHAWGTEEMRTVSWLGDLRERDHLEDLSIDGDDDMKNNVWRNGMEMHGLR
jgi:hypothetical protein